MASLQKMMEFYNDLMENRSDPRVKDWPLMGGAFPTLFICIFYALFVKVIGPKLMENRQPFDLRRVMIYYNLLQVVYSAFMFIQALRFGWWFKYSFICQPVDFSNNPEPIWIAFLCWVYFISRIVEFFDTIAFVLRKKNDNVSTLHVYHHASMPMLTWAGVKFVPGGHSSFFALLNTFVHTVMYSYYLLAALGPHMKPYLWWKKYLTTLQMIQFALVMIHSAQLFFIECDYPIAFTWIFLLQAFVFFMLFKNFYNQSYSNKRNKQHSFVSSVKAKVQ